MLQLWNLSTAPTAGPANGRHTAAHAFQARYTPSHDESHAAIAADDASVAALFRVCDKDGDGFIDYHEFVDVLARDTVAPAAMGKRGQQAFEAMGEHDIDPSMMWGISKAKSANGPAAPREPAAASATATASPRAQALLQQAQSGRSLRATMGEPPATARSTARPSTTSTLAAPRPHYTIYDPTRSSTPRGEGHAGRQAILELPPHSSRMDPTFVRALNLRAIASARAASGAEVRPMEVEASMPAASMCGLRGASSHYKTTFVSPQAEIMRLARDVNTRYGSSNKYGKARDKTTDFREDVYHVWNTWGVKNSPRGWRP